MTAKTSARAVARPGQIRVPISSLSRAQKLSAAALSKHDPVRPQGGVGKTSVAAGTAQALAESGHRTLLIDFDPQGHLTVPLGHKMLDIDNPSLAKHRLSEAKGELQDLLVPIKGATSRITSGCCRHARTPSFSMLSCPLAATSESRRRHLRGPLSSWRRSSTSSSSTVLPVSATRWTPRCTTAAPAK